MSPSLEKEAVSASEAKLRFGDILNQCIYKNDPIFIKRHDKTVAVMISYSDWKKQNHKKTKSTPKPSSLFNDFIKLRKKIALYQKKHKIKDKTSSVDLIRQMREERTSKLMKIK